MSVLGSYFNDSVPAEAPLHDDYLLIRKTGPRGEVTTVPEKIDYSKIQRENGPVGNWSFDTLVKAGIDPSRFRPHTEARGLSGYEVIRTYARDLQDDLLFSNDD